MVVETHTNGAQRSGFPPRQDDLPRPQPTQPRLLAPADLVNQPGRNLLP